MLGGTKLATTGRGKVALPHELETAFYIGAGAIEPVGPSPGHPPSPRFVGPPAERTRVPAGAERRVQQPERVAADGGGAPWFPVAPLLPHSLRLLRGRAAGARLHFPALRHADQHRPAAALPQIRRAALCATRPAHAPERVPKRGWPQASGLGGLPICALHRPHQRPRQLRRRPLPRPAHSAQRSNHDATRF